MTTRWLSIIGVGEDGRDGLSPRALVLIEHATLIVGGPRHLDLIGPTTATKLPWSSPLQDTIPTLLALRGSPVVVLASGDPFWFGVGTTLARFVPRDEMNVLPAPSSFQLAASLLGWPLQDTITLGLNTHALETLIPHLHPGARIFALSVGAQTPGHIARLLTGKGFGPSKLHVLEALGGPRERISTQSAAAFTLAGINPLNFTAIEVVADRHAQPIPRAPGLPDELFENDGQLTKREVRALTLSALAPKPGELLWDVGLGAGSIAIEWLLAHPTTRAIGFERDPERATRAARNALYLGVPRLDIRTGAAPEVLSGCPTPGAIFIGGGASPAIMDACWSALKPGGRLVANAVTLETEALLISWHATHGGTLTRLSLDRAESVGTKHGWRASMPVTQYAVIKP